MEKTLEGRELDAAVCSACDGEMVIEVRPAEPGWLAEYVPCDVCGGTGKAAEAICREIVEAANAE
jgi:DnaJ-class molecular chaperone